MSQPLLSMENVTVSFEQSGGLLSLFRKQKSVEAVDSVSLDIDENDVIALVGESGCGKTTLGKAAIGLVRPTAGSIKYRGQDIWEARDGTGDSEYPFSEIRQALQIIHQDPASALDPNHRIRGTLEMPLKKWEPEMSNDDRIRLIYKLMDYVGMTPPEDYAHRYPHQLSGGEKQRVALIRALLMDSDLILADEAISALDMSLRIEMMDLFIEIQESVDTSFLFISHDLANARYLTEKADGRIGVMYLGQIVEIGPVDQIIENPIHPYTKALRWATPTLMPSDEDDTLPLRKIDIPDPVDPPEGCRFHTRCAEAREVCAHMSPPLDAVANGHRVACFRADDDHEYWESPSLVEEASADGDVKP